MIPERIKKLLSKDELSVKNDDGRYPQSFTPTGKLRCPCCGACSFNVLAFTLIECETCYQAYNNFGIFGLEPVDKL